MSGKVLYRKYRPTKLKDVVGQEQVTTNLENALKSQKLGHAYLFIGPRGTGKTSVARIFAHEVNKFDYAIEDNYLDIIEIDAASNTGVDNIRELREKAVIAPTSGQYKVYIIDEVHMLTKSASNALLKTLEEPPEHVIFIMATTDAHKVPITISSRTQVFTFKLAGPETMFQYLQTVAKKEKIKITDDALKLVVRRGGGSFRDSMSLLDQITTLTNKEITAEILENALGLPQEQVLQQLLDAYSNNPAKIQPLLKDLLNSGLKSEIIASELINLIINNPQPAWINLLAKLPDVQPPFPEVKLLLAFLNNENNCDKIATFAPIQSAAAPKTPTTELETVKKIPKTVEETIEITEKPPKAAKIIKNTEKFAENSVKTTKNSQEAEEGTAVAENIRISNNETPEKSDQTPETTSQPTANFNWNSYLESIHTESDKIYLQLKKASYELSDNTLHLYPSNTFGKNVLKKPENSQILAQHLGNLTLLIHEVGENNNTEDPTLSKISDIMGDIREVKGDLPF